MMRMFSEQTTVTNFFENASWPPQSNFHVQSSYRFSFITDQLRAKSKVPGGPAIDTGHFKNGPGKKFVSNTVAE